MRLLVILLIFLSGCYTPVTYIGGVDKDEFLKAHFTPEAYSVVKDIPVVVGWMAPTPLAAGTNFWSKVGSFFIGCGIDRKIVLPEKCLNDNNINEHVIHEFIHHFHDLTLDGNAWLDESEFALAYYRCSTDLRYAGLVIMTEQYANIWLTNIFGISEYAEYIAYAGARAHHQGGPDYLENVYRKFLKPSGKKD